MPDLILKIILRIPKSKNRFIQGNSAFKLFNQSKASGSISGDPVLFTVNYQIINILL